MSQPLDFNEKNLHHEPIESASTLPGSWYTDGRFLKVVDEEVLKREWQYVCPASWLSAVGQCIPLSLGGEPIFVVNSGPGGAKGELRAFFNVCQHRAGPIVTSAGVQRMLRCRYHGWTYKLTGELVGTPKFAGVKNFDPSCYGLKELGVAVWQGMVFVKARGEVNGLEKFSQQIDQDIGAERLGRMSFNERVEYDVACNWKTYIDNFMEGYHVSHVHPELAKVLDTSAYVTTVHEKHCLQYSPLRSGENVYGSGAAFYYFIYPNIMLNILPGRMQVNSIVPMGPERTRTIFDYYYEDVTSPEALVRIQNDKNFSDIVQKQDMEICERVQEGLRSSAYTKGRLSVEEEAGVYFFQTCLRRSYSELHKEGCRV